MPRSVTRAHDRLFAICPESLPLRPGPGRERPRLYDDAVRVFRSDLATTGNVSTNVDGIVPATRPKRLPVAMTYWLGEFCVSLLHMRRWVSWQDYQRGDFLNVTMASYHDRLQRLLALDLRSAHGLLDGPCAGARHRLPEPLSLRVNVPRSAPFNSRLQRTPTASSQGALGGLKYTGTKLTASDAANTRSRDTWTNVMRLQADRYVACIRSDAALDLEVGKLYLVLPPQPGDQDEDLRVVDESGEDYLYPTSWFVAVEMPEESARGLRAARSSRSGAAG